MTKQGGGLDSYNAEEFQEDANIIFRTDKFLLGWQTELLEIIASPDRERVVHWIVDYVGHGGKSFMSQYLVRNGKGIIFNNFNHRDNSYLYEDEGLVVFAIPATLHWRTSPCRSCIVIYPRILYFPEVRDETKGFPYSDHRRVLQ